MTDTPAKAYTREEYVYLAKLYERAERFDDMVKFINKFVELDPNLSYEERNILSAGYKNVISNKRASWRLLNSMEKKEEKKNTPQLTYLKEVKSNIENEMITREFDFLSNYFLFLLQEVDFHSIFQSVFNLLLYFMNRHLIKLSYEVQ